MLVAEKLDHDNLRRGECVIRYEATKPGFEIATIYDIKNDYEDPIVYCLRATTVKQVIPDILSNLFKYAGTFNGRIEEGDTVICFDPKDLNNYYTIFKVESRLDIILYGKDRLGNRIAASEFEVIKLI